MAYKGRRQVDFIVLLILVGFSGVAAWVAAFAADNERIGAYWTAAVVSGDDGQLAQVVEVIDYDFGREQRRGIFRDVPGLALDAPVAVSSPTAPDQFVVEPGWRAGETRIKIGDAGQTIGGRHRYRIEYPVNVGFEDRRISWNAIGSSWLVGIRDVEVHLLADAELSDLQCSSGAFGSWGGCTATEVAPGHLMVEIDKLDARQGVTISAIRGAALSGLPDVPSGPTADGVDPAAGVLLVLLTAVPLVLLSTLGASQVIRRAGRELVWEGAGADAAYGPVFDEADYPVRKVDHTELDSLATTEFAPPKGLRAWQGGVIHQETTGKDQQVAWLLEQAIAGRIDIEGSEDNLILRRNPSAVSASPFEPDSDGAHVAALFGGRNTIRLAKYDKQFATAWRRLAQDLDRWHRDSPLWDPDGDRRRRLVWGLGFLLLILGLAALVFSVVQASRTGSIWLLGVAAAALWTGVGGAMVVRAWELRIRTPEGSGLWILIESFRRFIHQSDAQHVDAAAKQGQLLDYTAWAVALGEVDRWSKAVRDADLDTTVAPQALYLTTVAPNLGSATVRAATAPSSSGGGGGGGGSVGGGGGGGGGGSW